MKIQTDTLCPTASLDRRLVLFHRNAVLVGKGILANAGHLPGYPHARPAAADLELVARNFARDVDRRKAADAGKLIAKIAV